MTNCKLRLFTPRSSYGAKEMTPKSQLCACSFQDSPWQKNWALEQIREFPDTYGYVWTAENDSNTLRVDAKIFVSAKKCLRKKKIPNTCGYGLKCPLLVKKLFRENSPTSSPGPSPRRFSKWRIDGRRPWARLESRGTKSPKILEIFIT